MRRTLLAAALVHGGCKVQFRVSGTSMLPTIPPGSLVMVDPTRPSALRRGDIVMFSNPAGRLIAHRIVEVHADARGGLRFVLRGDNLSQCDLPVPASSILGRVRLLAGPSGSLAGPAANDNWRGAIGDLCSRLIALVVGEPPRAAGGAG